MWIESLGQCLNFIGLFLFIVPQKGYLDLTMRIESLGWCLNFIGIFFVHSTSKGYLELTMWIESLGWCLNFIGFFLFVVPQKCYLDHTVPNESLGWCLNFIGLLFVHSSSKGYKSWAYNVNKSLGWELWLTFEFHCLLFIVPPQKAILILWLPAKYFATIFQKLWVHHRSSWQLIFKYWHNGISSNSHVLSQAHFSGFAEN
jgi:hypothetical protein